MRALQALFDVQERAAAVRAVEMVGAAGKPETIRFKARKTLHEKQRAIDEAGTKGGSLTGRQLKKSAEDNNGFKISLPLQFSV